ncbi:hypothetical protein BaRGS_00040579 [Batillaria attramentaria]|uniref:Tc1-like transposase DDE domain-containing protein n=1 Tax=Batillaria attramentaria TaxID=370345 RepID=A0ABD0J0L6_9CAEN
MVSGEICGGDRTPLVIVDGHLTAQRYIDQIIRPAVLPYLQQQPHGDLYQQDNARPHTAHVVQQVFAANNVSVLPWPARSPDMSPREHLWDIMDRRIRQRPHTDTPSNGHDLVRALQEEWQRIPRDLIRRLTFSMRRRLLACMEATHVTDGTLRRSLSGIVCSSYSVNILTFRFLYPTRL